jgi:tetratricopeptide (TPR) repeat protein
MQRRLINTKVLIWTLASALVVGPFVHWVHSQQMQLNAGALLREADRALEQQDYGRASALFHRYLDYEPGDTETFTRYALTLVKASATGQSQFQTFLLLEQALRRQPGRSDLRRQAVQVAIELGRFEDAIGHLEYLLKDCADKPKLLYQLGWCQEAAGRYQASEQTFQQAIEGDPGYVDSYVLLADLLQNRLAQPEQAAQVMDKLVAANPQSWQAYLARGRFHFGRGALDAAEADIERANKLAPEQPEVLLAAAEIALLCGHVPAARSYAERGVELHPKNERLYLSLANIEVRSHRPAEAADCLRRGLHALPDSAAVRLQLSGLLLLLLDRALIDGRDQEALRLQNELRRVEGEDGIRWRAAEAARSIDLARKGDKTQLDLARRRIAEIRQRGDEGRVALLQAYVQDLEGNVEEAIQSYCRAFDLGERPPAAVLRVAWWLYLRQRYNDADRVLRQLGDQPALAQEAARLGAELAIRNREGIRAAALAKKAISPGSRDYRMQLWLANLLWLAGQPIEAEEVLREALLVTPRVPDLWVGLIQHLRRTHQLLEIDTALQTMADTVPAERVTVTMARCLEAADRFVEAERFFTQALTETQDDVVLMREVAEFYERHDQFDKAEPYLLQLLQAQTKTPADLQSWARRQLAAGYALSRKSRDIGAALAWLENNQAVAGRHIEDERLGALLRSLRPENRAESMRVFQQTVTRQPLTENEQFLLARVYAATGDFAEARTLVLALLTTHPDDAQYLAFHIGTLLAEGDEMAARFSLATLERVEPSSPRTLQLKAAVERATAAKR